MQTTNSLLSHSHVNVPNLRGITPPPSCSMRSSSNIGLLRPAWSLKTRVIASAATAELMRWSYTTVRLTIVANHGVVWWKRLAKVKHIHPNHHLGRPMLLNTLNDLKLPVDRIRVGWNIRSVARKNLALLTNQAGWFMTVITMHIQQYVGSPMVRGHL